MLESERLRLSDRMSMGAFHGECCRVFIQWIIQLHLIFLNQQKKRFFSYTSINHFIYQSITSFSLQFIFMRIVLNPFLHISVHSVWLIFPLLRWNAKRDEWEILIAICFKFDYLKYLIFSSFRWFVDLNPTIFSIWKKGFNFCSFSTCKLQSLNGKVVVCTNDQTIRMDFRSATK